MIYSLNWLKDYVDISISTQELADKLSLAGLEVEGITYIGEQLHNIYTGKIEKIVPHPNADKLVITSTRINDTVHQIVTGATNIFEGAIVPVALPGSTIANGTTLKQAVLRGVDSFGMLCSESELGVSDASAGIWILPTDTPIGVDFITYAGLKDDLIEISILPNRGDCQSIIGLAREIASLLSTSVRYPSIEFTPNDVQSNITATVLDTQRCPYYTIREINTITQADSPLWMQRRLQISGIRPINAIVDITNFVLLECGQPLHAFDSTKLSSNAITIRNANDNELFKALNGDTKQLTSSDVVIADSTQPIALAGVMGGSTTEVDSTTCSILLESAFFDPIAVRRTSFKHNLRTESSIRFEKTVDFHAVEFASNRAAHLLESICNATISNSIVSICNQDYPLFETKHIKFDLSAINQFLGSSLTETDVLNCLTSLGFTLNDSKLSVPSWRAHDIDSMPCIAEEIARIYGFDNLPIHPYATSIIQDKAPYYQQLIKDISRFLSSKGLNETNTFPMISESDISSIGLDATQYPTLKNPLTIEASIMRPSLLPSLLHVVRHNSNRGQKTGHYFEIAKTYSQSTEDIYLTIVLTGSELSNDFRSPSTIAFHTIKRLAEELISNHIPHVSCKESTSPPSYAHPTYYMSINHRKNSIGEIGQLHPKTTGKFEITAPVFYMTLNISYVSGLAPITPQFKAFSRFPSTRRDISLLAPKHCTYADIVAAIQKFKHKFLVDYFIFDLFESESIGSDNRSLGIAFIYQNQEETLGVEKVNKLHDYFVKKLTETLPITIR